MTPTDIEPILPVVTEDNGHYWRSAREHALKLPFCVSCDAAFYPPQSRCPRCLGDGVEWRPVSGRAKVYTWVIVHQVYDRSFADRVPYVVATVELEEGPRLITNIVNCEPEVVRANMPVRIVYKDVTDEVALVQFEPGGSH
jgi:uncharacterized OB-fold protein